MDNYAEWMASYIPGTGGDSIILRGKLFWLGDHDWRGKAEENLCRLIRDN